LSWRAASSSVALAASDLEGYRAVARHDREALLVPPDDAVALAAAAARLLDDDELRARLVAAGSMRADEHDWTIVAARTREIYQRATCAPSERG
jgi:glycosyltransferase involved in cell wall biosynthesis